jgi:hypothetical protein
MLLVRQVEVFELLLGRGGLDGGAQLRRELALLVDAFEHGGAAVFQLAQVGQAGLQLAQLDVVEAVGGFLAVAGDEGHGRATIEQLHRGFDLGGANLEFRRQLHEDLVHDRALCRT